MALPTLSRGRLELKSGMTTQVATSPWTTAGYSSHFNEFADTIDHSRDILAAPVWRIGLPTPQRTAGWRHVTNYVQNSRFEHSPSNVDP